MVSGLRAERRARASTRQETPRSSGGGRAAPGHRRSHGGSLTAQSIVEVQRRAGNRAARAMVRRAVAVGDDTDLLSLWVNARNYVDKRYGRRKILASWNGDSTSRAFGSYEELGEALDAEYLRQHPAAKAGRARPAFTSAIRTWLSKTSGGTLHRRHIVMSSAMRGAVYAVTDAWEQQSRSTDELVAAYNELAALAGVVSADTVDQAEANLVYVLHNNPANLVLDDGAWNSAIGSFATNVRAILQQPPDVVYAALVEQGIENFVAGLVKGFQVTFQKEIAAFWVEYMKNNHPEDGDELVDLLETMYDNAAVDLMSRKDAKKDILPTLLHSHALFERAASSGSLDDLTAAATGFIRLGAAHDPPYSKVLS